ncbi:MAG: DUF423 domain-containing protein [Gemmatimonadota bacterium]|nr:DUF423 domain-containing protein [Gemmatimonadota bacterium]
MPTDRLFFALGAVLAGLSVAFGAFGAHGLRNSLSPEDLDIFETGARYQMYHALALLAVAWAYARWEAPLIQVAGWLFVAGIVIFSGSLYALVLTGQRWLGAVTPIGGLALLAGWVLLAWAAFRA